MSLYIYIYVVMHIYLLTYVEKERKTHFFSLNFSSFFFSFSSFFLFLDTYIYVNI